MKYSQKMSAALVIAGLSLPVMSSSPVFTQDANLVTATDLVRLFFVKHTQRFKAGDEPLLNVPGMTKRFLTDCYAVEGLQGKLQFDPVYGGQDAEISGLKVYADPDTPILRGAAQIHLEFENFGQPRSFVYTLTEATNGEWQINDIYSEDDGWSLAELMRENNIQSAPCADESEVTLFDPPGDTGSNSQQPATESGMEDGDLPAHMDGAIAPNQTNDPDANVGMEQGDLPGYGQMAGGSDLLFILDGSGSMWGQEDGVAKISTAKQSLAGLIGDLNKRTNVGLMAYGHRREGDCGDIEVLLPVAKHADGFVGPAIEGISPRGKTPIAGALEAAAGAFPNADRQANVLLISDGLETCGGDPCAAAEALAAQGINTRVHVVGFDLTEEENRALQCIADQGNGNYYTANNAEEFVDAVNEAVEMAAVETQPQPSPEPAPAPTKAFFTETFDGAELDPGWTIINEEPDLKALDDSGALFIAAIGKEDKYDGEKAMNRMVLDKALPEGDFDLVLQARMSVQTGQEHIWVSLFDGTNNQLGANLWASWLGCGPALHLSLTKVSGEEGSKPEKTGFEQKLFGGPMVDGVCSAGPRAYGDAILKALEEEGATIRLKRRGRQITAALDMQLPAMGEDYPARAFSIESEPLTALHLSGKPSIFAGQWHKAAPGESHFYFDDFKIESVTQ